MSACGFHLCPRGPRLELTSSYAHSSSFVRDGAAGAEVDIEREVVPVVLGERAEPGDDVAVVAEFVTKGQTKGCQVLL
jgi:hypothetical protein